ncbi:MAG: hypothetical protein J3Q66DRAFT_390586 [Benniella sp.]|nr:MAG: hypothetical protein J3Q66DRAFT_390586 [Benniella sp.]
MTKRKHCPSDTVPAASVPSTSVQKLALPSSASSAMSPVQEARPSSMKIIVEWIADPQNSVKVNDLSRMPDTEVRDVHQEIATFVNACCHTCWTREDAWIYIGDIKEAYNIAAELSKSIGNGDMDKSKLRNDILCVFPYYDALKKVYDRRIVNYSDLAAESGSADVQPHFASRTSSHVKLNENNGDRSCVSSSSS